MADKKKKKQIPQAKSAMSYPAVMNPEIVGTYEPSAYAGGGYVWDEVLEYRVWCYPERGAPDVADGSDYYYPFESYEEALVFSEATAGTEEPLALILQREHISEPEPGSYIHMKEERITEWPVEFLWRPPRMPHTIPNFLAPGAPSNRLDILRGLA
jgi:putative acetyltransferase